MGTNVSVQESKSFSSTVNNVLTSIATDVKSYTSSSQNASQTMAMNISGVRNCNLLASQKIHLISNIMLENSTELANKMTSELKAAVKKEIKMQAEQANKKFNIGQANVSSIIAKSDNYIENNLTNAIQTGIENSVETNQDGEQEMRFNVSDYSCPPGGQLVFDQSLLMEAVSKNITKNIVNNAVKSLSTAELDEEIDLAIKQINEGIDMATIFIAIAVILAVLVGGGGFIYWRMMPSMGSSSNSSDDTTTGGDLGGLGSTTKYKLAAIGSLLLAYNYYDNEIY